MPEVGQNIEHWRGNYLIIEIKVSDQNGLPIDLSAVDAKWCFARSAQAKLAGDIFVQKSNMPSGGITIEPMTDGFNYLMVELDPVDTENVAPGNYYHEAEVIDGAGHLFTVAVGKFKLQPAVLPPYPTI